MSSDDIVNDEGGNGSVGRMRSIAPECDDLKQKYDDCFNRWFGEVFLKVGGKQQVVDHCAPLLKAYRNCVLTELPKRGIVIPEFTSEFPPKKSHH